MDSKDKTRKMFADLRKKGFVARQNYQCCGSCACSIIGNDLKEDQPYATYNKQNNDAFDGRDLGRTLYINFGSKKEGDEAARKAGGQVALAAFRAGLTVQWDGTAGQCVGIRDPEVDARVKETRDQRADDLFNQLSERLRGTGAGHLLRNLQRLYQRS